MKLSYADKEEIRSRVAHYNHARTSSQPLKAWTCGYTFKNPQPDYPAGKLIQDLGAKEMQVGDMRVSNLHANFFENTGTASSTDFCDLVTRVQDLAKAEKNIILRPEVKPIGYFTEKESQIWLGN